MRIPLLTIFVAACLALPAASQTLERIKETGQLKLGYRTDAAPLSFQGPDGRPAGYTPMVCANVAQHIADHLQMQELNAEFVSVGADDRFDKVAAGEIDLLCGAATITLTRRESVDFSTPTYVDGTAILLPVAADEHLPALAGKRLGVRADTTTEQALRNSLAQDEVAAEVVTFADHKDGIAAMESGEIDAYFADQSILLYLYHNSEMTDRFKISNEILTIEKQGLAMARGDADFRLVVDTALSELYANGVMADIFKAALPGATPGIALQAMYLLAPTLR